MRRPLLLAAAATLALTACAADDPTGEGASEGASASEAPADAGSESAASASTSEAATSEGDGGTTDGPTITVGSFNFPESQILANVYGQALEDAGYPVEYQLDVGSRELLFPELEGGNVDLVPEYVGSALSVGFGGSPTSDLDESVGLLTDEFDAIGVQVLAPAPGEDKNVYVVTGDFAESNGVATISDLADVGDITLAGPPECEERDVCYAGLSGDPYGLSNLSFESIPEGSVRIASLQAGDVEVATLFSTQPVINENGFVPLEDDQGLTPVENIVPVVSSEVADAYGQEMVDLVNSISETITTDVLLDLNGRVELDAQAAEDVAADYLSEAGL